MNIAKIDELVQTHLNARFQQLGSKNKLSVQLTGRGDWFFEEVDHWNYQAAIQATEKVWGVTPNITSEGGRYAVSTRESYLSPTVLKSCQAFPSLSTSRRSLIAMLFYCPSAERMIILTQKTASVFL